MPYIMTTKLAGDEISSTYEGRHIEIQESDMVHPTHILDAPLNLVDKGDPIIMGEVVGVAFKDALAVTDVIAVDTEGIWALSVVATDINGNSAVARGDRIYINRGTAVLSKASYPPTYAPFGVALSTLNAGATGIVAVKIHQDIHELAVIGGVTYLGAINVGGMATLGGGASVAGTIDLQTVIVHSSIAVAAGGITTLSQVVNATQLPAADPAVAGSLWVNAGVVTRSAG